MGEQAGATRTRTRLIEVDQSTSMLLDLLEEKMGAEPTPPNDDHHMGARYTEVARFHEQWAREVEALRMLCGVRLVNQAFL